MGSDSKNLWWRVVVCGLSDRVVPGGFGTAGNEFVEWRDNRRDWLSVEVWLNQQNLWAACGSVLNPMAANFYKSTDLYLASLIL